MRVLPEHRRQGLGNQLYDRAIAHASNIGAKQIETIVWEPNADGLRFAIAKGFVEVDRYRLDGENDPYITLRL